VTDTVRRGDIYYADLSPVIGSEQGGMRPVLIVQNDTGNKYSPTVIAAAITSQINKAKLPTHIELGAKTTVYHVIRLSCSNRSGQSIKDGLKRKWGSWMTGL